MKWGLESFTARACTPDHTDGVLDRCHLEANQLAVYVLRRVGNLPLREVAGRTGVSAARISQIQTKMEQGVPSRRVRAVFRHYKLKT